MAVTEAAIKEQLPPGLKKSGEGKEIAGIIDERLQTEQDVLMNQAYMMARARQGVAYESGAEFTDGFIEQVKKHNLPKQYLHQRLSEDTINSLQSVMTGSQQRDQQDIGNNAD